MRFGGLSSVFSILTFGLTALQADEAKSWEVPFGGNAYVVHPNQAGGARINNEGLSQWSDPQAVVSTYVRAEKAGTLSVVLRGQLSEGESTIKVTMGGKVNEHVLKAGDFSLSLGDLVVETPGYQKISLQGVKHSGGQFAEIEALELSSTEEGQELRYVPSSEDNRFYWGRRGPSVHLGYRLPEGKDIEYVYSEIYVPKGEDVMGSYFMANGFQGGYFGMQVNSEKERRVLFSIWSPFSTDNPKDIPEEDRIVLLGKGEGVYTGEFGNEGSGGQSYLVYPWQAGEKYRFLTQGKPDGNGATDYRAWFFAPEVGEWQLIAGFKRPKTDRYLSGFHSFLENFNPQQGHLSRMAMHGNQWARDKKGEWYELTEARFTADATARRLDRLDYAGGSQGKAFFMKNCGFFDETVELDVSFTREATPEAKPEIQFDQLPR